MAGQPDGAFHTPTPQHVLGGGQLPRSCPFCGIIIECIVLNILKELFEKILKIWVDLNIALGSIGHLHWYDPSPFLAELTKIISHCIHEIHVSLMA
jgi:hypothetical protein